jgi:hypothetical protein
LPDLTLDGQLGSTAVRALVTSLLGTNCSNRGRFSRPFSRNAFEREASLALACERSISGFFRAGVDETKSVAHVKKHATNITRAIGQGH